MKILLTDGWIFNFRFIHGFWNRCTSIGVDTTAREAFQHSYNQIFLTDAMTALTKEEHDYVCKYIFPKIGKLRTTEEIISLLK